MASHKLNFLNPLAERPSAESTGRRGRLIRRGEDASPLFRMLKDLLIVPPPLEGLVGIWPRHGALLQRISAEFQACMGSEAWNGEAAW